MDVREHLLTACGPPSPKPASTRFPTTSPSVLPTAITATGRRTSRSPREKAARTARTRLRRRLHRAPTGHVTAVEIAGPGFVNFRLADTQRQVMTDVLEQGVDGHASPTRCRSPPTSSSSRPTRRSRCTPGMVAAPATATDRPSQDDAVFVSPVRPTSMTARADDPTPSRSPLRRPYRSGGRLPRRVYPCVGW